MAKKKSRTRPVEKRVASKLPPGVKLLHSLEPDNWLSDSLGFDPSGDLLATTDRTTIKLWSPHSGKLISSFEGDKKCVLSVAFNPHDGTLASGGADQTVKIWEPQTGKLLSTLEEHGSDVSSVAFHPQGTMLASGSRDATIKLWDLRNGKLLRTLEGHPDKIATVAFDPHGHLLASGGEDGSLNLWEVRTGRLVHKLEGHRVTTHSVTFDPGGQTLASCGNDMTVKLWETRTGGLLRTLEGSVDGLHGLKFSPDGRFLAVREGAHYDDEELRHIRLWRSDSWDEVARIMVSASTLLYQETVDFHPKLPLLAAASYTHTSKKESSQVHIWELDYHVLLDQKPAIPNSHYINAKVVLLGDTGVGKSGLSLVLNGKPFAATDSTPGRKVWKFQSREVELENGTKQTRETLLWDLAGQPGYRVIHQLHLNEVAVALLVFDARSETDPLAGVRHWERAVRLAQQRQGTSSPPLKKFLVSARTGPWNCISKSGAS